MMLTSNYVMYIPTSDLNSLRHLKLWTLVLRRPMIDIIQYMSETFVLIRTYFVICAVDSQENAVCGCELGARTSTGVSKYRSSLWWEHH